MAYRLQPRKPVDRELRRLAGDEVAVALDRLDKARPAGKDVHEARKSLKKVRAIRRLVKADHGSGFGASSKRLSAVNQTLSQLRDADAMLGALDALKHADPDLFPATAFAQLRQHLASVKRAMRHDARHDGSWAHMTRDLKRVRRDVHRWQPEHRRFGVLAAGIRDSLERGRKAMSCARRTGEPGDFHEWRKALKALWYQLRLVERCGPAIARDVAALHRAESRLGDDHDLAVLAALLSTNTATRELIDLDRLRQSAGRQHRKLRQAAITGTRRLFARRPDSYVRTLKRLWEAAR